MSTQMQFTDVFLRGQQTMLNDVSTGSDNILYGLNEQQRTAVTSPSNVLQILAPPGAGKTKTLTTRVAHHIQEGLKPWNIIVCTFTIKAAREMKERIRSFVGDKLERKLVLGTFHSVARRYLSTYGQHIGVPKQFAIADSGDSLGIIKRIVKRSSYAIEPSKARSRISKRKSGLTTARPAGARIDVEQQEFEAIFDEYEAELAKTNLLDYDDLLLRCVELLTKFPECVSNVEAVLIDEFQDTNHVQYELMNLFAQHREPIRRERIPKITIVGDPDQSIYSFRSAEIENLMRMRKRYPDNQVVHLEENYRSSGSILQSAIEVIEQDTARPQKKLLATHTVGQVPVLRALSSAAVEAAWLVGELQRSHHLNGGLLDYSDYAILVRSASLSRHIETELGKAGIPYRMVGGHKFFERVEVRLLLDYLRVISQPDHNDALLRVINTPPRNVGDTAIKTLLDEAVVQKRSLWSLIKSIAKGQQSTKISSQALKGLDKFVNIVLTARRKLDASQTTIEDLLGHVTQKISLETFLRAKYKDEYEDRAANVDELVQLARSGKVFAEEEEQLASVDGLQQRANTEDSPTEVLGRFLANIALATDADKQDATGNDEKVVISTIHAAKGLEWPVVFIPATYEGSIPHSRSEDTDEERRLLYVGMTRAKTLLYLSWPRKSSASEPTNLSSFLTTPTIARYFNTKGPSFGYSVTRELAGILRRECPLEKQIVERFETIGQAERSRLRAEDDYYPEDGEERKEHNPNSTESSAFHRDFEAFKRRKVSHDNFPTSLPSVVPVDVPGFVSAKERMEELAALELNEQSSPAIHIKSAAPGGTLTAKASQSRRKVQKGQGSIASFFPKTTSTTTTMTAAEPHKLEDELMGRRLWPSADFSKAQDNSSYHSLSRTQAAPVASTGRKIKTSTLQRPQAKAPEDNESTTRYVLLSSSPTKPDADLVHMDGTQASVVEAENIPMTFTIAKTSHVGFTQASTFHKTSMDKLNQNDGQLSVARSLGARPGGNGKANVNKPYVKPTFRKPP